MLVRRFRLLALATLSIQAAVVLVWGAVGTAPSGWRRSCVVPTFESLARAESRSLDGPWTMSALGETFSVRQWSGACGPPPVSRTLLPAGPATLHREAEQGESKASEIVIATPSRVFRTDGCIDPLETLSRDAHASDGRTFRTRCSTPTSDPRRAIVNAAYFLTGTDDTLTMAETGVYEFTIEGAHCVADVSRQAALHRAALAPADPVLEPAPGSAVRRMQAADTPGNATHRPCEEPDEPARLEVRPSRKLLRSGDVYAFRARVVDAQGCPTPTPIKWSLGLVRTDGPGEAPQPTIDSTGRLSVPAGDFADAMLDVVATASGRSARASVQVTSPRNFEALLAESGLGGAGEREDPSVAVFATSSIGAAHVLAEDGARRRKLLFIVIIGGLSLGLAAVAAGAAVRVSRAKALEQAAQARHLERMRALDAEHKAREAEKAKGALPVSQGAPETPAMFGASESRPAGPLVCPSCRREFVDGGAFCPHDANRLVPLSADDVQATAPVGGLCPTCRRGFNPGIRVCPIDGDELVAPALLTSRATPARGKICPTCGGRFDGGAAFCGQDGTQLVLLN